MVKVATPFEAVDVVFVTLPAPLSTIAVTTSVLAKVSSVFCASTKRMTGSVSETPETEEVGLVKTMVLVAKTSETVELAVVDALLKLFVPPVSSAKLKTNACWSAVAVYKSVVNVTTPLEAVDVAPETVPPPLRTEAVTISVLAAVSSVFCASTKRMTGSVSETPETEDVGFVNTIIFVATTLEVVEVETAVSALELAVNTKACWSAEAV